MPADVAAVRSLYLPLEAVQLLVPGTMIAEIVSFSEPSPIPGAPDWLLGAVDWRGYRLPLVEFETLVGGTRPAKTARARIAVVKASSAELPYYGIVTREIPKLIRVVENALETAGDPSAGIAARVLVNGEPALIPDFDHIENALQPHWRSEG